MDLLTLRDQLDVIDAQIVELYEKRVFDRQREQEKLAKVKSLTHNEFNSHGVEELFEQIMSMSRKLQYQMLAEQGSQGK